MARATGAIRYNAWIEFVPVGEVLAPDGRSVTITYRTRVRRWHPGYWLTRLGVALFGMGRRDG